METAGNTPWWVWPLLIVALPFVALAALAWLVLAFALLVIVWLTWLPRGQFALMVYSATPVWQPYFEAHVLPALGSRAVVLNWSERKKWGYSLPVLLFRIFAGPREFNPLALVFRPLRWPRRFRFYRPFIAFKHGRPSEVEQLRDELIQVLDEQAPRNAA
jgi:hypothetical protein